MNISDVTLLEVYHKAVEMDLDKDFIHLLEEEISMRNLQLTNQST